MRDLADYDVGILNDFGGGDVDWWLDYLRAEIGRSNDYWREQVEALAAENAKLKKLSLTAVEVASDVQSNEAKVQLKAILKLIQLKDQWEALRAEHQPKENAE